MNEVPNIISTKDLAYIEDALNWTFTCCKKINTFIDMVSNKEIKKMLNDTKTMYEKHYDELLNILE